MTRCQHCKKLTHSEDLNVYFDMADYDKVSELRDMEKWVPAFMYNNHQPSEVGKLKCGDIIIHFIAEPEIPKPTKTL